MSRPLYAGVTPGDGSPDKAGLVDLGYGHLSNSEKVAKQQRVQYKSMGPQRFVRGGSTLRTLRLKVSPKSRPSGPGSSYLMWDESLMQRDHLYAEQLAAVSRRSQQQAMKNLHAMTSTLKQ